MSTLKSAIAATLLASFVVSAQQAAVEQTTTAAAPVTAQPAFCTSVVAYFYKTVGRIVADKGD